MAERSVVVRLRAEVGDFKRQMESATKPVEELGRKAEQSSTQSTTALGRMVQSAETNRQAWDTAGTALTAFGAVTVGALALTTRAAMEWETAWTGVLKTVDGTDAQLAEVEEGLRELARTLPATHQEIAAVAEAAGQLGVRTGDIVAFTRVMVDLGETTNLTAGEAATAIAQLMNVMQTAPEDVGRLGASLVALGNDGASTERDIILMAQRIAGAGRIIGLTEGEVMGLANALSSVGIEVEAGGTAISNIMTDIAKSVSTSGDDLEKWAQVAGMSAQDFAAAWKADPAEALALFIDGLGRMQAAGEDVFTTLDDLGQADVRVSRALLTMATSGDLLRESLELGNQAWADNTALAEEAAKRYDTTEAKLQIAKGTINDTAISLGENLLPALASVAEGVADVAEWFGQLPQPVQASLTRLTGVAGVTALAAGAFLLTFPRVIETVRAFRTLREVSPGTATAVGKVGKAAGAAGIALAALAVIDTVSSSMQKATASVEETTAAVLTLGTATTDLDAIFQSLSDSGLSFNNITGLEEAITRITKPGFMDRLNDIGREITSFSRSEGGSDRDAIVKQFNAIGDSLAFLVESGNIDIARDRFEALRGEWEAQGGTLEDLRAIVPSYVDALTGVSNEAAVAEEAATGLTSTFNALTGATEQLTDAQVEWRAELAEINAAFVDPLAAYDELVQKNRDAAQAAADSTKTSKDSWEDFSDQFPETVSGYLDELQKMVDAQANWETNMLLLSGRVSQGTLDELARMGPEGAPLVAQLVNASDEELARMEGLFAQRSGAATDAFATTLDTSAPIIAAAAAQLGDGAAREIAAKLAAGTHTVEQIMWEYKLNIEGIKPQVQIDTTHAQARLDQFIRDNQGRKIYVDAVGRTVAVSSGGNNDVARAFGGPVFGPGTETSDSVNARLSNNEHVWAAREVKGAGGHMAVERLRALARQNALPAFATGGAFAPSAYVEPRYTMPAPAGAASAPVQSSKTYHLHAHNLGRRQITGRDLVMAARSVDALDPEW